MTVFTAPQPLLSDIFALHGKWRSDDDAVICDEGRLTWSEFCASNHQLANALVDAGIEVGGRVGVVMSNGLAMVQALFGTMAAGAVSVPINLSVSDDALLGMLEDAGVSALIVSEDQRKRLSALESRLPEGLLKLTSGAAVGDWQALDAFVTGQSERQPGRDIPPDTPLNIIYSSGTTGLPKGIVQTQRGRRDWAYDLALALRYHAGARTLLTIGLYSNISWVGMLCTLLAGGCIVVQRGFSAAAFLDTAASLSITHTAMVPVQYREIAALQVAEPRDVSSLQSMMSCGSPLHENLKRQLFELFPCGVIELYGLTEGIITTLDPEVAASRLGSVGRPLPGTDLLVLGGDDRPAPTGESGEIVYRGRITMPGYWNRPAATREAEYLDEDGLQWLRSGDIGYLDEGGYLYIVDRKKDMILSGGQNIYPQDIEAVLVNHDAVADVAVIGLASQRWGETPVAVVVPAGDDLDTAALREWVNARVGRQQRVAGVLLAESLPRNPNGKILKRELREMYRELCYD